MEETLDKHLRSFMSRLLYKGSEGKEMSVDEDCEIVNPALVEMSGYTGLVLASTGSACVCTKRNLPFVSELNDNRLTTHRPFPIHLIIFPITPPPPSSSSSSLLHYTICQTWYLSSSWHSAPMNSDTAAAAAAVDVRLHTKRCQDKKNIM